MLCWPSDCPRKGANNIGSFPLNRSRGLAGGVVDDPVDAADLVDDAVRDPAEKAHVERVKIRRHAVDRGDRAQRADRLVGAIVAHHAHGLYRQQHRERLPDRIVQAGRTDLREEDRIRLAQNLEALLRDLAEDADREAGAGEGVAADKTFGQAQLAAEHADLVLEQLAQRFDQRQRHALGQAADIVVRLDRDARALKRDRLDDVRIERALRQKIRAAQPLGLLLEDVDEGPADDLALVLGIGDADQALKKQARRVNDMQGYVAVMPEQLDDLLHLARAQEAGIDQDADQLVAPRLVQQQRRDRRIDAAREAADHPAGADLLAHAGNRLLAKRRHRPVGGAAGHAVGEAREQFVATGRVHDLGMELHAVDAPAVVGDRGERRALRDRDDAKALRQLHHLVAVAHPDLLAVADLEQALEQRAAVDHLDERAAELAVVADLDLAAELGADGLLAVADAQYRHALREHRLGRARRADRRGRGGAAREDDGLGRKNAYRIVADRTP